MKIRDGFVGTIGNTPLIKLRRASEETGCTILGKAEFLNPGGSVKDRPARHMILEAEKRGELRAGGVVVESTAGNTGIGLALVASARGYRTVIVIPETQSQEKKDTLRLCGAELIEVPAVPYSNPNQYQHVGRRLAEHLRNSEPNGVIFADQWNNLDNRKAHYETTGPEIWQDTDGRIDGFICSIGTGGTIAGVSTFLCERNKDIVIGVADPTFDAQSAGWDFEHVLHRFGAHLHRLGHVRKPETNADDVGAGRQHEGGGSSLVLLDQARDAVLLGAIDPPMQSAVDGRQIIAEPRADRERALSSRHARHAHCRVPLRRPRAGR